MSNSKKLLSGSKFNQTHQSYLNGAESLLRTLKGSNSVKKIMLGEINPVSSAGLRRCKVRSVEDNLVTLFFRDVSAAQVIRFVATDVDLAIDAIKEHLTDTPPKKSKQAHKKSNTKKRMGIRYDGRIRRDKKLKSTKSKSKRTEEPKIGLGSIFPELSELKESLSKGDE